MNLELKLTGLCFVLGLFLYGTSVCDVDTQVNIITANHNSVCILDRLMQHVSA
jgi:hypothetical protein